MKPNKFLPPAWRRALAALAAVAVATMLSSCAHLIPPKPEPAPEPAVVEKKPPPEPIKPPPPSPLYEWWGANEYLSHIEVDVNEQKARFYSGDKLVGWTTVASGIRKFPTPIGSFAVTEKVQNKKSNLYGKIYNKNGKLVRRGAKMGVHKIPAGGSFKGAPMPYFLRLTNDGIGMHAGPIPRPGNRASHGCIRMPKKFAPILYHHVDIGTRVTIKGNGPTYASYLAKQRRSTPKPTRTAVVEAASPRTRTSDTTPTPEPSTTGQPATASSVTATAPESAEIPSPSSAAAATVAPAPNTAEVPGNASNPVYGTALPSSPMPGHPPPAAAGMRVMPSYPPAYAVPAAAPPAAPARPDIAEVPSSSPSGSAQAPTPAPVSPAPVGSQAPESAPTHESTDVPAAAPPQPKGQQLVPAEATPPPATTVEGQVQSGG